MYYIDSSTIVRLKLNCKSSLISLHGLLQIFAYYFVRWIICCIVPSKVPVHQVSMA